MTYKEVRVSNSLFVRVPKNLTPDEEADYVASRIAFVNLEQLEADCRAAQKLMEEGPSISMEDLLAELSQEVDNNGKSG